MSQSERHHWVPRFIIKNFADTDGRVFKFGLASGRIGKTPPKYAASSVGFYDFKDNGIASVEKRLSAVESGAALAIKRIIAGSNLRNISDRDRSSVSDFIGIQSFRTEAMKIGLQAGAQGESFEKIFEALWDSTFLLSTEIMRRKWILLKPEGDLRFWLGDSPVAFQDTENPGAGGELGFDVVGVEAFFPLSPTAALYMPCRSTSHKIETAYRDAKAVLLGGAFDPLIERFAPHSVPLLLAQTRRVLSSTAPLYNALNDGSPLMAGSANVINFNYLQYL